MLREYRQLFVKNGFDLSYEQVVLNQPEKSEIKATKKTIKEAEEFAKEQKEASQKLEEQQSWFSNHHIQYLVCNKRGILLTGYLNCV